jgi:hypothetical protein
MVTKRRRNQAKVTLWGGLVLFCVVLTLLPVQGMVVRSLLVGGSFLAWAGGLLLFWPVLLARIVLLLPLGAAVGLVLMPYRNAGGERLQVAYTAALKRYEGVRYRVGGQSAQGLDAIGLVRRAMIDACFQEGWRTKDLSLLRSAAALWWYEIPAEELTNGYHGRAYTLPGGEVSLGAVDYSKLHPGDLAVPGNSQNVFAYLGNKTWITTAPGQKTAIREAQSTPPTDPRLQETVTLVRWYRLQ